MDVIITPVASAASYDGDDARRLWEITERLRGPFGQPRMTQSQW